jgi:hypothetical protein
MMNRIRRDERGFVLVVVVLSMVFLLMLVTAVMDYSLGSQNLSRHEQDWNAALAAAEAGVDDYIFHMNQDGQYWMYGNSTVLSSDPRYGPTPPDGNQAFTTWVQVPGGTSDAYYRYDRDTTQLAVDGTIRLTVTGKVRGVSRSIQTSLRRRNFLDYLYFTDYETKDPAIYTSSDDYTPAEALTYCAKYYYAGRDIDGRVDFAGDTDGDECEEITFPTADTINGPLHTNDAIRMNGSPNFNGPVSTSYDGSLTGGQRWWGSGTPDFAVAGDPSYSDPLTMPPNNSELRAETDPGEGGCLFTGPTAIRLNTGTPPTMDVISPLSKVINCSVTASPDANLSGTSPYTITRMTLPSNGIIYVQSMPTSGSNFTSGTCGIFSREAIGGTGASNPNRAHPLGFPQRFDVTPTSWYGCTAGDVFLHGTLDGRLTIAAENNIVLFSNVTYAGGQGGDDMLGLVPNNYVEVYHPASDENIQGGSWETNCDGTYTSGSPDTCNLRTPGSSSTTKSLFSGTTPGTSTIATQLTNTALRNPTFSGPVLSVAHSFRIQNYTYGSNVLGTMTVFGALAQRYRGIVSQFNSSDGSILHGYAKNYVYDQRLKYDSPPKFLNPVASAWQVVTWSETKSVYDAGAA